MDAASDASAEAARAEAGAEASAEASTEAGAPSIDASAPEAGALPSGNAGIAARHPRDVGIASDPAVLFAEDFERYGNVNELWSRWTNFYGQTALTTVAAEVHAGRQALRFTLSPATVEHADGLEYQLPREQDVVFLRWYQQLDRSYDVTGSSHQGGGISAHYNDSAGNPTPGVPANGTNKYLATMELWRDSSTQPSPGNLNVYLYHPEQRDNYGDHFFPNGDVLPNSSIPGNFGPTFQPRPNVSTELGRWYCFELMLRANTPGVRDGRIALWLDGAVVADFPNLRLRDVATLTMDRIGLMFHARANPVETHKWVDDVVVATSYIGPLYAP